MKIHTIVNSTPLSPILPSGMVTLDFIRDTLGLKGTKESCREGDCGTCMVLVGKPENGQLRYRIMNSCLLPLADIDHSHLVTIEGLNMEGLSTIQRLFVSEGATQCGFCSPGFIVSVTGYLLSCQKPQLSEALAFLSGNICRCTGYRAIERALEKLLNQLEIPEDGFSQLNQRIDWLIQKRILPEYFLHISDRLAELPPSVQETLKAKHYSLFNVAGGTDLYVQRGEDLEEKEIDRVAGIDVKGIIELDDGRCSMGAATTISELTESEIIRRFMPHFSDVARLIACTSIRNRATVGGNIVNASPIGDMSIILLALNASILIEGNEGQRETELQHFFKAYKQLDLSDGERLKAIILPSGNCDWFFNFEKVSKRTHLDIASVNSAMHIKVVGNFIVEVFVSAGGVAPVPLMLHATNRYLKGRELTPKLVDDAISTTLSEISPISDARGSAEYKRLLLKQLIRAHFERLSEFLTQKTAIR